MASVFVTGASGFLGQALLPGLLAAGHDVLAMSRAPQRSSAALSWVTADLRRPESYETAIARFAPQILVHLAWEGLPDYGAETSEANAAASTRLFDMAVASGCGTLLAVGTCWEYGVAAGPVREDAPAAIDTPFQAAKARVRAAGERIARQRGTRFVWVRPFFVYGPGQRPTSLIPSMVRDLAAGQRVSLRTPGVAHDFVFVDDVAAALVSLLRPHVTVGGVFNVGSGTPTTVAEVARVVAEVLGANRALVPSLIDTDVPGPVAFWAGLERIIAETGWRPSVDLTTGIRRTIASMRRPRRDGSR